MGYTHYFRRAPQLEPQAFQRAVLDIKEVLAKLGTMGVKLAGPQGTGFVELTSGHIAFNGVQLCGHGKRDLGITWPSHSQHAGGVGSQVADGHWFGGALLMERTCGGDCSHESFWVDRDEKDGFRPDENGRVFAFCKTAYKPYDLAVTAALIILKHHLRDQIVVGSDGEDKDWRDAGMICQMVLGYGADFRLPSGEA